MTNTYDLKGKKILITGANGRLGSAYVEALLQSGAFVYATDIQDRMDATLTEILATQNLSNYEYLVIDITHEESLKKAEAHTGAIDVLINNAGAKGIKGKFEDRSAEDIDQVLGVQLKGAILCTKVFSKEMIEKKSGKIVNIASIYGMVAPDKRMYDDPSKINSEVYGATKAGIIQFTKYLASYLGEYHITANCVSPGGVQHDGQDPKFVKKYSAKAPLGRMANPKDLVDIVCFLSSDGANYVTGQNIAVDGGFTAW
jgi:3-oxoacyl-[acyl-carrier protein] reductase